MSTAFLKQYSSFNSSPQPKLYRNTASDFFNGGAVLIGSGADIDAWWRQNGHSNNYDVRGVFWLGNNITQKINAANYGELPASDFIKIDPAVTEVLIISRGFDLASGLMSKLDPFGGKISAVTLTAHGWQKQTVRRAALNRSQTFLKRLFDGLFAASCLIALLPLFLLIAAAIKFDSPGSVFYRQKRWGQNAVPFKIFKFRSMRNDSCDTGQGIVKQATQSDARITKVGAFLRKTSLDELPQLINVLLGDMSLVGPRPHADAHNEFYAKRIKGYMARHRVKPGLTGRAQIKGLRGETPQDIQMQARVHQDNRYIGRWRLRDDISIVIKTAGIVLSQKNAY